MRERIAYVFLVGVLITLMAITFGVLGKGHYQPPKQDEGNEKGYVSSVLI